MVDLDVTETIQILNSLTERQKRVLGMISLNCTNRLIAETLGISPSTVKSHTQRICVRLGVDNRHQAAEIVWGMMP